jgi:hypothetical protein
MLHAEDLGGVLKAGRLLWGVFGWGAGEFVLYVLL